MHPLVLAHSEFKPGDVAQPVRRPAFLLSNRGPPGHKEAEPLNVDEPIVFQMKMKRIAPALFVLLTAATLTLRAATPPPEKLLPADTLAVFTVPDYAKADSASSLWASSLLWNDPAMKAFKDKFMAKFKAEVVTPLEREMGIKFADYAGLAQGQITFAITQNTLGAKDDKEPGFLMLLDARDKSGALKTNLAELKKKWVDSGKKMKTAKVRDVEFTTLVFSSEDLEKTFKKAFPDAADDKDSLTDPKPKKTPTKIEWMIGQSDSLLIVGNVQKDIEKTLLLQSGGSVPTLAEQAQFAPSYAPHFRDSLFYGWVNLKAIIDLATKAAGGDDAGGGMKPSVIMAALGLNGLQSAFFNFKDTGDGCLMNFSLRVPESGRKGLMKVLAFQAKESSPPPFVPADAVAFSRTRLDLQKALEAIEATVIEINPQAAGVIKMIMDAAGKDKDPNFDLRKNLIANLGDDIISYQKTPKGRTLEDISSPPALYLLGSPNSEQLASALKALTFLAQGGASKLKEREFLGRKIYSMPLPNMGAQFGGGAKGGEKTLHYAASGGSASGGYVAISTDVAMLEEYLRSGDSKGKTLRETPGLAEAAQKVGGMSAGFFGYDDQARTMPVIIDTLKKEPTALATLLGSSPLAARFTMDEVEKKFKEWVDFSLLPSSDKIAKYFHFNVYGGGFTPDGLSLRVFSPVPPQLKK